MPVSSRRKGLLYQAFDEGTSLNAAGAWSRGLEEFAVGIEEHEAWDAVDVITCETRAILKVGNDVLLPLRIVLLQFVEPLVTLGINRDRDNTHLPLCKDHTT